MRQLLGCWLEGDDTVDFVGLDQPRWEAVRASGVLAAVAAMVAGHAPSLDDEGSLELHEHAIACWSAACGLQPDGARTAALCEAGAVPPTLRALEAVTPVFVIVAGKQMGGRNPDAAEEEEVAAAAELVRAACALLQALARTEAGRAALRCAGGAATLDALLDATVDPSSESEMHQAIGALRRRLVEGQHGQMHRPGGSSAGPPAARGALVLAHGGLVCSGADLRPLRPCRAALVPPQTLFSRMCLTIQEGGGAEEPPPLSEAERRDGATPRGDEVPSYSARDRGGDGPKQKQHAAARAASGAERVLPETTWMGTGPPDEQPPADAVAVGKQPKAKPRKKALFATYSY